MQVNIGGNVHDTHLPVDSSGSYPAISGSIADTGAKGATFNGATQTAAGIKGAMISLVIGAPTGTSPTLTAQVQVSPDGGTTWVNLPGAVTATINAAGTYSLFIYPGLTAVANSIINAFLTKTWRLVYTIGGSTPSFPINAVSVAYVS